MSRRGLTSAACGLLLPAALVVGSGAGTPAASTPVAAAPRVSPGSADGPELGTWTVTPTGEDSWTVTWRSPDRLPVGADRPTIVAADPGATSLGDPTVADDGRTVEVTVTATEEPDPDQLDVVLSGEVLDEGTTVGSPEPGPDRWTKPERDLLDVDPGLPGSTPTTTSDYVLDGITVPRMPEQVEMVGHVVEPAGSAADPENPLVLFLHGRHSYCYNPETDRLGWRWPCRGAQEPIPSQLGYHYIQKVLASQGYVTVSIAANGINAQDGVLPDGGASARSQLIQAHLDQWAEWAAGPDPLHQVDLDNVVLVGHSRGGEGVSRASLEIPLTAPYTVVGQVLIGPTNFGRQTTPYVPTVTVLPSCDGDVIDLQGQSYTDLARGLATGDTAMKSSVMAVGANHNFFNTEWTPGLAAAPAVDDWGGKGGACGKGTPTRLTAAQQRTVGKAYVAGAVHLFADGDQDFRPMYDGTAARVGSTGDAVVLSHMVGGDREVRLPGADSTLTEAAGAGTLLCKGVTPWGRTTRPLCGRFARAPEATPHWPVADSLIPTYRAFQMSWTAAGGRGGLSLQEPLDLTGRDYLDLRTVVDPKVGDVAVDVRLTDADGTSVVVEPVGGGDVPALPTGDRWLPGKYWAQTLRVAADDVTQIDASRVAAIELVGRSDAGRVWVLDVAAASAPLPVVPEKRVPIVDLGRVTVQEGGNGTQVAKVPYTVTGKVARPAVLWLYSFGGAEGGTPVRQVVTLPAGSDDGTISWEYEGDLVDDRPRDVHELVAYAVRDVMMRDNQGRIVVVDDDPAPEMTLHAVHPRAQEGGTALFEVTLSDPVGYDLGIGPSVLRGDTSVTPLHAHDVRTGWLRTWTSWKKGTDPALHRLHVAQWTSVQQGDSFVVFGVPIRDDARSEGVESLTVQVETDSGWRSGPVTVLVPAGD